MEFAAPDYVVLVVEDLARTAMGVPGIVAPADRAWGQRTAYLKDPDGYLIELAQDREADAGAGD